MCEVHRNNAKNIKITKARNAHNKLMKQKLKG